MCFMAIYHTPFQSCAKDGSQRCLLINKIHANLKEPYLELAWGQKGCNVITLKHYFMIFFF